MVNNNNNDAVIIINNNNNVNKKNLLSYFQTVQIIYSLEDFIFCKFCKI